MVVHVKDLAKLEGRKGPSSPGLKVLPGNWVVMPHLEKEAFSGKALTFFACRIQRDFPRLIKAPLTDSEAVTKSAKAFHLDCGDSKKGKGRHFTSDKIHIHFARNFKSRGGDGSISLWRHMASSSKAWLLYFERTKKVLIARKLARTYQQSQWRREVYLIPPRGER